jgi:hypothetical protein
MHASGRPRLLRESTAEAEARRLRERVEALEAQVKTLAAEVARVKPTSMFPRPEYRDARDYERGGAVGDHW